MTLGEEWLFAKHRSLAKSEALGRNDVLGSEELAAVRSVLDELDRLRFLVLSAQSKGKGEYEGRACPWCESPVLFYEHDSEGNYVDVPDDFVRHEVFCPAFKEFGVLRDVVAVRSSTTRRDSVPDDDELNPSR